MCEVFDEWDELAADFKDLEVRHLLFIFCLNEYMYLSIMYVFAIKIVLLKGDK